MTITQFHTYITQKAQTTNNSDARKAYNFILHTLIILKDRVDTETVRIILQESIATANKVVAVALYHQRRKMHAVPQEPGYSFYLTLAGEYSVRSSVYTSLLCLLCEPARFV